MIDDVDSLANSTRAVLWQRAATGAALLDADLRDAPRTATVAREAEEELTRWHDALLARIIPFRKWDFADRPVLTDRAAAARSDGDLRCLLRGAAVATDLNYHYTAAHVADAGDMHDRPDPTMVGHVTRRFDDIWRLEEAWPDVITALIPILERRLVQLRTWDTGRDRRHNR